MEKGAVSPRDAYFLRAESFYNVATNIDELDDAPGDTSPLIRSAYGGVSLHEQSHGESFLALVRERFSGGGLYILDEPEAALSPVGQMALLARIHELAQAGAQLIIATHSPLLTACPGAQVYEFRRSGPAAVPYRETAHFQILQRFYRQPEAVLHELLDEPQR